MAVVDVSRGLCSPLLFQLHNVKVLAAATTAQIDLEPWGAVVQRVRTSRDALALLRRDSPDVLICELDSLDAEGLHLIRQVRARSAHEGGYTPAIALTATTSQTAHTRALLAGYQAALHTGVAPMTIAGTIRSLLDGFR